jgi:hypothetical protein
VCLSGVYSWPSPSLALEVLYAFSVRSATVAFRARYSASTVRHSPNATLYVCALHGRSFNEFGLSDESPLSDPVAPMPESAPFPPRTVVAHSVNASSIMVMWTAPSYNGGAPIELYTIVMVTPARAVCCSLRYPRKSSGKSTGS